jgi:hypothetical protein
MDFKQILKLSINNELCVNEVLLLYLIANNDFTENSLLDAYINKCGNFSYELLEGIVKKGYLENFNTPGEFYPEYYMLTKRANRIFANEKIGKEFWESYPATFFMRGKNANFVARAGADKDYIINEYLKRIDFSASKHEFVIAQIKKYKDLVNRGVINGHKISDFVKGEMWDVIAELDESNTVDNSNFGIDL